jgi:hypothetical protein
VRPNLFISEQIRLYSQVCDYLPCLPVSRRQTDTDNENLYPPHPPLVRGGSKILFLISENWPNTPSVTSHFYSELSAFH